MEEIKKKIIKFTKSGKIDMRGRVKKQSKLTDEEKKLNARLACKKFSENNKKAHNATYKKYYDKNKTEINKRRNEKKAQHPINKLICDRLEKKLIRIWRIKGLII